MVHAVLVTIGSLGDLHPFIAIGRALTAQRHHVTLAVPEDAVAKVKSAGLDAAAILPSYASICERLGLSREEVAARVLADTNFVLEEILIPSLQASTAALDELSAGADVVAGSIFAFAADIVAEKRRLPLATIVLQPMSLFSAWDPPIAPHFERMRHRPRTGLGRGWNRLLYSLVRATLRQRYARRIDAVRAEHGLGPGRGAPMLDHGPATATVLCCWSSVLGALPPDAPGNAALIGFPFFDSESGADEALAPELDAFFREGEPPLIFTLGSFAVASAGAFYEEAVVASRRLGMRALMLTGEPGPPRRDGDCLFTGYAPHSLVFPLAAAVIHHGGVGTTGQALRAGCPQVIVPHFGDQFDNAARLQAAGISLTIRREKFEAGHVADTVSYALSTSSMREAAHRAAEVIANENASAEAARRIVALCG